MYCNITCRDLIQSELESHIISETETNLKDKLNKVVSLKGAGPPEVQTPPLTPTLN